MPFTEFRLRWEYPDLDVSISSDSLAFTSLTRKRTLYLFDGLKSSGKPCPGSSSAASVNDHTTDTYTSRLCRPVKQARPALGVRSSRKSKSRAFMRLWLTPRSYGNDRRSCLLLASSPGMQRRLLHSKLCVCRLCVSCLCSLVLIYTSGIAFSKSVAACCYSVPRLAQLMLIVPYDGQEAGGHCCLICRCHDRPHEEDREPKP